MSERSCGADLPICFELMYICMLDRQFLNAVSGHGNYYPEMTNMSIRAIDENKIAHTAIF